MGIFRPGPECRRQERSFAETWPHNHSGGAAVCFSQASEEKNSTLLNLSGESIFSLHVDLNDHLQKNVKHNFL